MKNIKISGIESKENRISLLEDIGKQYPVRYSFFMTWQGNNTDVYDQFLSLGVQIGKNYDIEVVEKPGKNAGGKEVVYRNITKFYDAPQKTPKINAGQSKNPPTTSDTTEQPNTPHSSILNATNDLAKLEEKIRLAFKTRDERIDFLMTENKILSEKVEGLIGVLTEEQLTSYEFHKGGNGKMEDLGEAVEVPEEFLK